MKVAIAVGPGRDRDADDFLGPALRGGGEEPSGLLMLKARYGFTNLGFFSFRRRGVGRRLLSLKVV